jgi:hypothetical protein
MFLDFALHRVSAAQGQRWDVQFSVPLAQVSGNLTIYRLDLHLTGC